MNDMPADTAPVHLWALSEDVSVEHDEGADQVVLHSRWGVDCLDRPEPEVREALRRMELGPMVLANVAERQADLHLVVLPTLSKLSHLVVRTLSADDLRGPLLSVFPVAQYAPFTLLWTSAERAVRLPRQVVLTVSEAGITLETADSPYRVVLHRPEAALVVAVLAWPVTPDEASAGLSLPPPLTKGIIRYLVAAGMAAPVDDDVCDAPNSSDV